VLTFLRVDISALHLAHRILDNVALQKANELRLRKRCLDDIPWWDSHVFVVVAADLVVVRFDWLADYGGDFRGYFGVTIGSAGMS